MVVVVVNDSSHNVVVLSHRYSSTTTTTVTSQSHVTQDSAGDWSRDISLSSETAVTSMLMLMFRVASLPSAVFTSIADTTSQQRLRSSTSDHLLVLAVKLSTVGRRAFPVAGARIQNDLPSGVTSVLTVAVYNLSFD